MAISTAQEPGIVAPFSIGRSQLLAGVIALLLANVAATKLLQTFAETGAAGLVSGLGMSWTYWLACAACLRLAWTQEASPIRPIDLWLSAACAAAAIVPISQLSSAACTALGLAILFDRSHGERTKAAAIILLAISVQVLWSRLVMLFFEGPIGTFDAHALALMIQRPVQGNEVQFIHGPQRMSILGGCTSVQNASLALMLFVAIVRSFRPKPQPVELLAVAGLLASVVAINYGRLVVMAQSLATFEVVHDGIGRSITEAIITVTVLVWAIGSVRREAFP